MLVVAVGIKQVHVPNCAELPCSEGLPCTRRRDDKKQRIVVALNPRVEPASQLVGHRRCVLPHHLPPQPSLLIKCAPRIHLHGHLAAV